MQPALAIPYFTGVLTFIGNIFSLSHALRSWQDTIVNKVLEQLQTFIDPIKPQLLDVLEGICHNIDSNYDQSETSPFAGISSDKLAFVRKKLDELYCSIEVNNFMVSTKNGTSSCPDSQSAGVYDVFAADFTVSLMKSSLKDSRAEAIRLRKAGISAASVTFRKLSESEIVALLSSFWSSIR